MRRFPLNLNAIHSYFSTKTLLYVSVLRMALGLSYIHILLEHYLDSEFIRVTSSTKMFGLGFGSDLAKNLSGLMSSDFRYCSLVSVGVVLSALFIWNRFAIVVPILLFLFQQLFFLLNDGNMYGHELFFQQFFMMYMLISVADHLYRNTSNPRPEWALARGIAVSLFQLQLLVVYFISGVGKWLSPDWNQSDILQRIFLNATYRPAFFDFFFKEPFSGYAPANAVPVFLVVLPFLILIRQTRKMAFIFVILFHVLIAAKTEIYGFSLFMIGSYLIFFTDKKPVQENEVTFSD